MKFVNELFLLPRDVKKAVLVLADSTFLPFAFWLAFVLRMGEWNAIPDHSLWILPLVPIISIPIFIRLGLYRAVIRYMGGKALYTIVKGVILSSLLIAAVTFVFAQGRIPYTVVAIYCLLSLVYIGGGRLLVRDYYKEKIRPMVKEPVAIFGAGSAGVQLANGLMSGKEYKPVAFIDEKSDLIGGEVANIQVYSPRELPNIIKQHGIRQVLLAIPSASRIRRKEILLQLEPLAVHVRTIPGLAELVTGTATVEDIQEVDVADLLGRDTVPPDEKLLSRCISGKSVMVTGAGGSIGSELCRQILKLKPKCLIMFESSEYSLYKIGREIEQIRIEQDVGEVELQSVLGSVTHRRRVESVIRSFGVQTIYHAAAYKHVPLVEHNPVEGVQNNLFGTWHTAEAAMACSVETFVLVSTDKAVRPTNIMGASKRMAELVLQGMAQKKSPTRFCMVRFGNVLGSSGSVVPLFYKQIRDGGPVTVTHSEITRYFMTIPEAAQLVLQAGSMGEGGEVFVLDMGESVRIADLARRMVKLSGLEVLDSDNPNGDIEIVFTGLRPGEKLFEELLIGDNVSGTKHPRIMGVMEHEIPWEELEKILAKIHTACVQFDTQSVRDLLQLTVSGYAPQCGIVDPVWIQGADSLATLAELPDNVKELMSRTKKD